MPTTDPTPDLDAFIARWRAPLRSMRANYVLFLSELCTVLDLARPDPQTSDPARDAYVFEKPVPPVPRRDRMHRPLHARLLCAGGQAR